MAAIAELQRDPGSFRDPSGYVFSDGHRVFRMLDQFAGQQFEQADHCGLLNAATERLLLIPSISVNGNDPFSGLRGARGEVPSRILEHPRVPVITYPYEWTFGQLKDAALRHLELHLLALQYGFELSDATAYNMQFDMGKAFHIDVLSIRRYRVSRPWEGYNQFCRQFLFPLLVESMLGVPFQRLYRGSPAGIELTVLKALLPVWRCLSSLNMLMHVQLQSAALRRATSNNISGAAIALPEIPKTRYVAMLEGLTDWISTMKSGRPAPTYWAEYAAVNSYSSAERAEKQAFVQDIVHGWVCTSVVDVGGNSGDYSEAALAGGATRAYCVDGDVDALELAYAKRKAGRSGLFPLVIDWSDPSPGQGWAGIERPCLMRRLHVDAVIALAVVHHIVIGGNVPLANFIDQLFVFGRRVIVEFVPRGDPMVDGMLRNRDDIFGDYTESNFVRLLEERSQIQSVHRVREGGRVLFACESHANPL